MTTTYGVISDLHAIGIQVVPHVIEILKHEEVDALVLNGDLFGERSGVHPQQYLATLLDIAARSGLETYVLPGSHEEVHIFEPVLLHFTQKYGNIIDTFNNPKIVRGDHHLVFLQGSDWRAGGALQHGYSLGDGQDSGFYPNEKGFLRVVNISDLQTLVTEPERTIVFSHVPRRFDTPETGVDMAEFWETQTEFQSGDQISPVGSIFPGPVGIQLARDGAPVKFKRENRGNEDLRRVYDALGISKGVTGHFHESAGRATDAAGVPVEEGVFASSFFYNASYLDQLLVGMVSVNDTKVAYENFDFKKYGG